MMRFALIALSLTALAACNSEITSEIYDGEFGNSTMNNTQIQSGDISAQMALTSRFASEVPDTITFAFNSAVLDGAAQATLRRQADWIRQFPEVRFAVYGHTDLVGSNGYNQALGLRRAKAVVAFFASQGISRSRLEALVSYGKTQPVVLTDQPEQRNRRTVTQVSGFVNRHPSLLNGKYAAVIFREYVEGAVPPHPESDAIQTELNPGQ
ncbi:OmpA family protein [Fertoebacter nigrum]|uniref:OmpA family protein n=1 Tax=Fertoeibacter niger TaxID=2656921 RepID=A0A8X8GTQ8_9RHOB|nr:OmpA family protein [Fertoeibacter niger]NUB44163.1 OmpA family protein [Fertoeibacter niger]